MNDVADESSGARGAKRVYGSFQVLEKIVDKPLRIRGVAMAAGLSRNFNFYAPDELQVFAPKLVGAPIYIEHVAVSNAVGKVMKTEWLPPNLWYEAEIYDDQVAEQIRKGIVQHVSIGADYEAVDVVTGKVLHGLHNAELSLVAVPGFPETNIQVLERLRESLAGAKGALKQRIKEQSGDVSCVCCGVPAEYLISVCQSCFDNFIASNPARQGLPDTIERMKKEDLKKLVADEVAEALKAKEQTDKDASAQKDRSQKYGIGIKQGGNVTKPNEYSSIPEDQFADPVNFKYPVDAGHVQAALGYFNQPVNRTGYTSEEQVKILAKIVQAALAAGTEVKYQPEDSAYKGLPDDLKLKLSGYTKEDLAEKLAAAEKELTEQKAKFSEVEGKLAEKTSQLSAAQKTIEQLQKQLPEDGLLKNPPKVMRLSEHIAVLEGLLPVPMVEKSTLGMQRECQMIRSAIFSAKEKLKEA